MFKPNLTHDVNICLAKLCIIAVAEFQGDEDQTSDCDMESMKGTNEHFEQILLDESESHALEVCEASSMISLSYNQTTEHFIIVVSAEHYFFGLLRDILISDFVIMCV